MPRYTPATPCPCGRKNGNRPLAYSQCCALYIEGDSATPAPDPEALMRSRYTAFVMERADYLLATWAPAFRPETLEFEEGLKWLGLEVRDVATHDDEHGEVEFVARSRSKGRGVRLHERSRFKRVDGKWFYTDGEMLA